MHALRMRYARFLTHLLVPDHLRIVVATLVSTHLLVHDRLRCTPALLTLPAYYV